MIWLQTICILPSWVSLSPLIKQEIRKITSRLLIKSQTKKREEGRKDQSVAIFKMESFSHFYFLAICSWSHSSGLTIYKPTENIWNMATPALVCATWSAFSLLTSAPASQVRHLKTESSAQSFRFTQTTGNPSDHQKSQNFISKTLQFPSCQWLISRSPALGS